MVKFIAAAFLLSSLSLEAIADPDEQVDLLVTVKLDNGLEQAGVLTVVKGDRPSALVMLMPGDPGVLRSEVAGGRIVKSRMPGHTFVRARHLLVRPGLAAVLVDCRSDMESCGESYVMSKERFDDVAKLLAEVKRLQPGIRKVWVAGHSFGTLSSASLARYGAGTFDGSIHASTILFIKSSYRSLVGYDYSLAKIPQLFIHHRNDPCQGTPYAEAERVAGKYNIPIVTITEASGQRGGPCGAFSEHGFVGAEKILMQTIADAVERGVEQFRR